MSLYINDNFFSSSILPYACGHKVCWPGGHSESKSCFATSGELSAHFKDIHIGDNSACEVPPFRCGLKGCGKSWKVRLLLIIILLLSMYIQFWFIEYQRASVSSANVILNFIHFSPSADCFHQIKSPLPSDSWCHEAEKTTQRAFHKWRYEFLT